MYRPPGHPASFFEEFQDLLGNLASIHSECFIFGDFNLHYDIPSAITTTFNDILVSFDLKQHVNFWTHIHDHWLDLLITRSTYNNIQTPTALDGLSDHHTVIVQSSQIAGSQHFRSTCMNSCVSVDEERTVPQNMRDANIITLYKNKGDRSDCNIYRGISLLCIVGKVFVRVALARLQTLASRIYPESQCGFRAGRSTVDMMFSHRQLQEKWRDQQ